jgi:tRNA G18 (ribose-2'-O)-methylase SpoU
LQIKTKKQASKIKWRGELLYGIQPVSVALQQRKRKFERLYLKRNADSSTRLKEIRILAGKNQIPVSEFAVTQLTKMCPDAVHQGVEESAFLFR